MYRKHIVAGFLHDFFSWLDQKKIYNHISKLLFIFLETGLCEIGCNVVISSGAVWLDPAEGTGGHEAPGWPCDGPLVGRSPQLSRFSHKDRKED